MFEVTPQSERRESLLVKYGGQLGRIIDRNRADLAFSRGVKLQRADSLMRNIVESSFDGIITLHQDGRIETANDAALGIFGFRREELVHRHFGDLLPKLGDHWAPDGEAARVVGQHRELDGQRSDGSCFPVELAVSETWLDRERLFVAIVRDITERKRQEGQLQHQALHDALTGLPNRLLLTDRLTHALDVARRDDKPLGLLLLDLDRFKEINDTLGHHTGDLVLSEVARRLVQPIRRSDTIARLGGDEFAVLLPAVTNLERARRVSDRIVRALEEPFHVVDGLPLEVNVSIGIAMFPEHADDGPRLLQCADVAMYTAKQAQCRVALYDPEKDHHSVRHLTLTGELRQAIEGDQLAFHYQPQIDLVSGRVCSVEALARWHHKTHGPIPPEEFILQAERTGLIQPLSRWAFTTALRQLAEWRDVGIDINIAVNLSARNLHEQALPDLLRGLIADWRIAPERLNLEITESAIMLDPESAMSVVSRLADIGVRLAIDDFGTGYSSLAYLKRLPVNELKIDQSFVMHMSESESDAVIVRSTIDLAHNLGLQVVAEGIQGDAQIAQLRDLGCEVGQGYFIGTPQPIAKLTEWLQTSPWGLAA